MSRLFLFGIGGTGSRVIKSLMMLLAAGVEFKASEVIPIIIDPDEGNGDLLRTLDSLNLYRNIHESVEPQYKGFFETKITTLNSLVAANSKSLISNTFSMNLSQTTQQRFGQFIGDSVIQDFENRLMIDLLYTSKNRADFLSEGFLGNPNVGSVVLNTLQEAPEFQLFGNLFNRTDDRIFIVSSIFGGTGAAGFPLLLKIFRSGLGNIPSAAQIKSSIIGGVTVMPYFNLVENKASNIDSNTFITKTKAALSYYDTKLDGLNALYYIGDTANKPYNNCQGGTQQKNKAHFVELIAATSIIDFMSRSSSFTRNATQFYEYSINSKQAPYAFDVLGHETTKMLKKPLTKFFFLSKLLKYGFLNEPGRRQPWKLKNGIDDSFTAGDFYNSLLDFINNHYYPWLEEMQKNDKSFTPFALHTGINDMSDAINMFKIPGRGIKKFQADDFDVELNKCRTKKKNETKEKWFMESWNQAAESVYNKRIKQ